MHRERDAKSRLGGRNHVAPGSASLPASSLHSSSSCLGFVGIGVTGGGAFVASAQAAAAAAGSNERLLARDLQRPQLAPAPRWDSSFPILLCIILTLASW